MIIQKIRNGIRDNFYIIYILLAFLSFRFNFPGFFRSILWGLVILATIGKVRNLKKEDNLILIYCLFAFTSLIGYALHPYPFELYLNVIFYSYVPIIFYFIGRNTNSRYPVFYERAVYACVFCFIVGFYWYLTMPSWYVQKSLDILNLHSQYTEETMSYARFASYLDSYHIGNLGVFSMICSLGYLQSHKKNENKKKYILFIGFLLVSFIALVMSQQRVSMFVGIFIIFLFFYKKYKFKVLLLLPVFVFILAAPLIALHFVGDDMLSEIIISRFRDGSNSSSLLDVRSETWINALFNQRDYLFGHGVGGGGQYAYMMGVKPTVNDGSYFKILLETGIFSLGIFIYLLINALKKSYSTKYLSVEHAIVFYYAMSMIGANVVDMPYIIVPYWYALGRIFNRNYNKCLYE